MGGSGSDSSSLEEETSVSVSAVERPEAACLDFASRFVHGIKGETDGHAERDLRSVMVLWEADAG